MVNVLVKVKYPPHKQEKILKVYTSGKAAKYLDFVRRIYQWVSPDYDVRVYNIYEIPDNKLVEGLKGIAKRFNTYTNIKGNKFKVEILLEGSEAIRIFREK